MQLCRRQSEGSLSDPGRSALGLLHLTGLRPVPVRTQIRIHSAKLVKQQMRKMILNLPFGPVSACASF